MQNARPAKPNTPDTTPTTPAPLEPVLLWVDVRGIVKLSRPQIWRLRQANQFPAPIRLSKNRIAWRAADVRAWLDARPAA